MTRQMELLFCTYDDIKWCDLVLGYLYIIKRLAILFSDTQSCIMYLMPENTTIYCIAWKKVFFIKIGEMLCVRRLFCLFALFAVCLSWCRLCKFEKFWAHEFFKCLILLLMIFDFLNIFSRILMKKTMIS